MTRLNAISLIVKSSFANIFSCIKDIFYIVFYIFTYLNKDCLKISITRIANVNFILLEVLFKDDQITSYNRRSISHVRYQKAILSREDYYLFQTRGKQLEKTR